MIATTGGYPSKWIVDLSVFTKKAVLDIPDPNSLRITWSADGGREEYHSQPTDLSLAEARHFIGAAREGGDTITPISEGARTLAATLAIRESGIGKEPKEVS